MPESVTIFGFAGGQMEHRIFFDAQTGKCRVEEWYSRGGVMVKDKGINFREFNSPSEVWEWLGKSHNYLPN